MSIHAFQRLSSVVQLLWVIKRGTFLANRWEDDDGRGQAVVLRSFNDSEALEDYAQGVRLPD